MQGEGGHGGGERSDTRDVSAMYLLNREGSNGPFCLAGMFGVPNTPGCVALNHWF